MAESILRHELERRGIPDVTVASDVVGSLLERAFADGVLLDDEGPDSPLYALGAYAMITLDRLLLAEAEMTRVLGAGRS